MVQSDWCCFFCSVNINHNHPNFYRIWEIVKEERKDLSASIKLFNKSKIPYSSINYTFIAKLVGAELRQRIDRYTAEQSTPQVNNEKSTKETSTLHKKMLVKDAVALLPQSYFRFLSQQISPGINSKGSNSSSKQGTSNHTLTICLVTLSIAKMITPQLQWVKRSMRWWNNTWHWRIFQ